MSLSIATSLDAQLRALESITLQLNHCSELLRRRSVPRVAVLHWLTTRLDDLAPSDLTEFANVKKN
jgi:hypothetical protein